MYRQIKLMDGTIRDDAIFRPADNTFIPFALANTDYQQYLKWLEEGNQPLPADEA